MDIFYPPVQEEGYVISDVISHKLYIHNIIYSVIIRQSSCSPSNYQKKTSKTNKSSLPKT